MPTLLLESLRLLILDKSFESRAYICVMSLLIRIIDCVIKIKVQYCALNILRLPIFIWKRGLWYGYFPMPTFISGPTFINLYEKSHAYVYFRAYVYLDLIVSQDFLSKDSFSFLLYRGVNIYLNLFLRLLRGHE